MSNMGTLTYHSLDINREQLSLTNIQPLPKDDETKEKVVTPEKKTS